jgi:phosphoribosylamine--glycine ligase
MMAALTAARIFGCSKKAVQAVLDRFKGLEHRLVFVREIGGVRFYNDSKGTNVGSVVKSLQSFSEPVILIAGGKDKNGDLSPLKEWVRKQVKHLILIGEAKERMKRELGGLTDTVMAETVEEAVAALDLIMIKRAFGKAGDRVVVEECLKGEEASFMAFTDGKTVVPMASSQDHKRIFDGDKGPNTGGMGAYSPAPVVTKKLERQVMDKIMIPTVQAMEKERRLFKGVLYAGLMIHNNEAKVLEFNARFGDPETQPIMMRLDTDIIDIIEAILAGNLSKINVTWKPESAVCVVMASGGYPGHYEKGKEIKGLENAAKLKDVLAFHAGTALKNGKVVTDGGRVLGVTGLGSVVAAAIDNAYAGVHQIFFEGAHYRRDIGARAIETGN